MESFNNDSILWNYKIESLLKLLILWKLSKNLTLWKKNFWSCAKTDFWSPEIRSNNPQSKINNSYGQVKVFKANMQPLWKAF
jgi:hypothetical protein